MTTGRQEAIKALSDRLGMYFDYQSSTPVDPDALTAMKPWYEENCTNASNNWNKSGLAACRAVDTARTQVATLVNVDASEIYFTSGATEGNNWLLKSLTVFREKKSAAKPHIIVSSIEHKSILATALWLRDGGHADVDLLPVDRFALVQVDKLKAMLRAETVLVSVMAANNEVGTLQPIREIVKIAAEKGIPVHSDIAQCAAHPGIDLKDIGVQYATWSAHKLYGPKGIGALYMDRKLKRGELTPLMHGGPQESGMRSGTTNVPAIVGFGKASELALMHRAEETERICKLRDFAASEIAKLFPHTIFHGHKSSRLPHNLAMSIKEFGDEEFSVCLRAATFSSGSACQTGVAGGSHVLKAMSASEESYFGPVRLSFGRFSTIEQVSQFIVLCRQKKDIVLNHRSHSQ
jgi:cysteine desulfurase